MDLFGLVVLGLENGFYVRILLVDIEVGSFVLLCYRSLMLDLIIKLILILIFLYNINVICL